MYKYRIRDRQFRTTYIGTNRKREPEEYTSGSLKRAFHNGSSFSFARTVPCIQTSNLTCTLHTNEASSSETSVSVYQNTRRYVTQNLAVI
jgi:hypothetical protein